MARPGGAPENLKRGGSPGRPKKAILPSRNELLELLTQTKTDDGTLLNTAVLRFKEIVEGKNGQSIEWLFNQLIGSPKSTIVQEIQREEWIHATSEVTAEFIRDEEEFKEWSAKVRERLSASNG